ncbi:hypothetical protein NJB93_07410 [Brucella intermedia]|uniref:hypothetical protein n=1 Tax=Brucella intermedia TaxID=94625 RepID=UPI002097D0D1|nr:hypothetical protein [Brucella intermedia]MCO7726420.1 hypothetical protein [Brucella intermedia]
MTTLPEEAVKAAAAEIRRAGDTYTEMAQAAISAALPFLSVQGAVKKLEWRTVVENGRDIQSFSPLGKYVISIDDAPAGGTHYLWVAGQSDSSDYHSSYQNMFEAKAAAQADFEARILSALEPSAARELVLYEGDLQELLERLDAGLEYEGWAETDGAPVELFDVEAAQDLFADAAAAIRALSSPDHIADAGKVEGDGSRETLWKSAARDFGAYLASNGTPYAIDYWNECFGPLFSAPASEVVGS